ncbi:MAG TPA: rhomboid family intramembrane serine protease [Planctomycetota bacterium]|jgi:membrane associated rhomboid family serine protease
MFFPYADDNPPEGRLPWMNWLLILANVFVFLAVGLRPDYEQLVMEYGFVPARFSWDTVITSMFMHAGWMHLIGNMWFLYLFGDNVENRCGPIKYLLAYLACGVAGDFGQMLIFQDSLIPSIGASGAIFGVLGMYLFFFPRNRVKVFMWIFLFIYWFSISALWVIGAWFVLELFYSQLQVVAGLQSGVGHLAHSGGFVAGFFIAVLYHTLRLVPNDGRDLFAVITGRAPPRRSRYIQDEDVEDAQYRMVDEPTEVIPDQDERAEIAALLHAGRTDEARRAWRRYAFDHHSTVLPLREQLEVALALDKHGERSAARDAYERLLMHYPNEQPYAAEASLALAGMLLQELKESGDNREVPLIERLLRRVIETHPYENRRQLAQEWLAALQT